MVTIPVIIIAIKLSFPLAKLGVFIILLARFITIFKVTINTVQSYFAFYPTIDNMLKLIDKIDSQKETRSGALNVPKKIHKIEFQNIYFKYDKNKQICFK